MSPLIKLWPTGGIGRADEPVPSIRNTKSPGLPSLSTTSSSTRPLPLDQPQLRPSHSDDGEGDEGGDLFLNDLYDHTEPSCARDRLSAPQAPQVFRDSRSKITHAEPTAEPRTFRSPSSLASRPAQNPYATPASTSKKRRREENLASGSDECRTKSKTSGIRTLSISELMDQERERRRRPSDGLQHPSTEKFLPCQPASQAGVATDMPQDLEAILQQLPPALQSLTNILIGPQSPMTLVRDLATKVNEQRAHIQRLERKLWELQEHVHVSFTNQERQTKAAIGEMSGKCNEVLQELDRANPLRVPGGPYGGTPFREPKKRSGFIERMFPSDERRRVVQPRRADD